VSDGTHAAPLTAAEREILERALACMRREPTVSLYVAIGRVLDNIRAALTVRFDAAVARHHQTLVEHVLEGEE
jgi:hypothetical protein